MPAERHDVHEVGTQTDARLPMPDFAPNKDRNLPKTAPRVSIVVSPVPGWTFAPEFGPLEP